MREYELILIIHPDLDETAFNDLLERVSGWIKDDKGEVIKTDIWGQRELAYPIHKQKQGQYVLLHVRMSPKLNTQLERNLRFTEPVLRYMLTSK